MSTKIIENKISQLETKEILRSQIKLAEYNPRVISDDAVKLLKDNLKEKGLMGGIIWNERTNNLISGHQRISIIDRINRYEEGKNDYKIKVEVANISENEEKEQNIFLNNTNAQGQYDEFKLKDLLIDIDYKNAGLTDNDLLILGVNIPIIELSENEIEQQNIINEVFDFNKQLQNTKKEEIKVSKQDEKYLNENGEIDNYKKRQSMLSERKEDNDEYIDTIVFISFDNKTNKKAFLNRFDVSEDTNKIKGEIFSEMIERIY